MDGALTAYPNDDDGRDPLELTVHVLSNDGFQICGETRRCPPMTVEERADKKANRMVLYAMHPAGVLNLCAYASRMQAFKTTIMTHLLMKGAVDVGFIHARDNEGSSLNRTVVFVGYLAPGLYRGRYYRRSKLHARFRCLLRLRSRSRCGGPGPHFPPKTQYARSTTSTAHFFSR